MTKKKKKKVKIKYKNVFKVLFIIFILVVIIKIIINMPITNIYIKGNVILSDQEVIRIAKLEDYPSSISNSSFIIKKRLIDSEDILSAKVIKRLGKVYIEVEENRPLFYNSNINQIVLIDGTKDGNIITPYLVNYIPDTIYDKFITKMSKVDIDILNRISDIEYKPNNVDQERFYLTMTDGNYVYIDLNHFVRINNYVEMISKFNNKKGILYLDSGEYFEIKN